MIQFARFRGLLVHQPLLLFRILYSFNQLLDIALSVTLDDPEDVGGRYHKAEEAASTVST